MATAASSKQVERAWNSQADFEACTREVGVDNSAQGVRLAESVMMQDELGRTHISNQELLSDRVWARKDFILGDGDLTDGTLYFYATAKRVTLNGKRLKPVRSLPSTGWSFVRVPGKLLQKGLNSFVFSGGGNLLVADSLYPNRSARSVDGGRTWDYDAMGPQGMNDGEYLVRLRLNRYPAKATLTSEVIDFADLAAEQGIRSQVRKVKARLTADVERPQGTQVRFEAQTASEPDTWSPWEPLSKVLFGKSLPRYFRWRAILGSKSGDVTPTLQAVTLKAEVQVTRGADADGLRVVDMTPVATDRSSHRFAYQEPSDRLTRLCKQYKLKRVVTGARTELEKLVALRNWCRHTAPKGWDRGRTDWCPPWDALIILETNQEPLALCMCTHYSTLFVQTAAALGYVARHVILDHHCVAEVWSNELRKWILMDTGNSHNPTRNCHFEHNGIPLNALEIRRLFKAKQLDEIRVVYTDGKSISGDKVKSKFQCDFSSYRRFSIPLRNNHLETPFPGELTQGSGEYFCDAYLWWEDKAVPADSPEYGLTSNRPGDFYWPLNETAIELTTSKEPGKLIVDLRTTTPNFDGFMVRIDGKKWQGSKPRFTWQLKPGRNIIAARSVNTFGVKGPVSRTEVEMQR